MAFKIKSTNPKSFQVKPNKGDLLPQEEIRIELKMQPQNLNFQMISAIVMKERFLIQAMEIENNQSIGDIQQQWAQSRQEQIANTKLTTFLFTKDQSGQETVIQNSGKK